MRRLLRLVGACLCVFAVIAGAVVAFSQTDSEKKENKAVALTLWQIDSFEGGKGSRAEYLQSLANNYYEESGVYTEVTAVSADAARANIESGNIPDIISYGSGFYGIESLVDGNNPSQVWCRGAYCLITLDGGDFTQANAENTVINGGKDNLTGVAALFAGVSGADTLPPQSAYVSLLDGQNKFLLGTQRDIVRLMTRGVPFSVSPIEDFCDLFQNISVLSGGEKGVHGREFVSYVQKNHSSLNRICMMYDGANLYDNALHQLENISFDYTVSPVISSEALSRIKQCAVSGDINMLKTLLKPL